MPVVASSPAPAAPAAPAAPSSGGSPAKSNGAQPVKPNPVGANAPVQSKEGAPPAAAPTTPQRHKWTAKIDGKEQEIEASDDDLRSAFLLKRGSEQRFQESARAKKEAAEERQRAEQTMATFADPTGERMLEAFMRANPESDPVEVLAAILQKRMAEEEQLQDPNIRERRRLERENQDFRTQKQKADQEIETRKENEAVDAETERVAGKFKEAIALTKLPINDMTIKFMAEAEFTNRQRGWDLTPEQLARSTEKAMNEVVEAMMSNEATTDDQLLATFPKLTSRIHKAIVARYRAKGAAAPQRPSDITPRERRPSAEGAEPGKPRVLSSAEEHKAYGSKGLRSL